ncbi:dynamin family protein [Dyadobacter fanqingshengii]|uniref:Dynamin family protein n=1 Tax=Dyadobacter fanqingshengii TaxID=2906443 RepID=A0A9X1P847_9BACT|nr:dynamin family protein [Dyadobacter fanqingshengii]MCF0039737.1 dynamin family protein [Dyadobacter fanqingshengii]USJ38501.1 dynamin family protein [Dyadobacter fanqingshengii]
MEKTIEEYFTDLEKFKKLHFEVIKSAENLGNDIDDLQQDYDSYVTYQSKLTSDLTKIATDNLPLTIGIVGNSNTGKSSLINSLIGAKFLGIDELPATSKITVLSYQEEKTPKIFKVGKDGKIEETTYEEYIRFGMHQHEDIVDKEAVNKLDYFEVHYPAEVLKKLQIVDTPGFSTLSEEDDAITKAYLKKTDLLLWIFDAGRGTITDLELKLLQEISDKRIIAIINRIDMKPPFQRAKIVESFASKFNFYKIFTYSAKEVFNYQKAVHHNTGIYNELIQESLGLLNSQKSFSITDNGVKLSLTHGSEVLFEKEKLIVFENEFIQFHDEILSFLQEIRQEVSDIKINAYFEELLSFHSTQLDLWKSWSPQLERILENRSTQYADFEKSIEKLKEKLGDRARKYYAELNNDLAGKLFDELFRFDYQEGGFFEADKHFIRMKALSDSDKEDIKEMLESDLDVFYNKLSKDLRTGLAKLDIELETNYELSITEILRDKFAQASYESVLGLINLWQDVQIGSNYSEIKDILYVNISLCVSENHFCDMALLMAKLTCTKVLENHESDHLRHRAIIEQLANVINMTIHE